MASDYVRQRVLGVKVEIDWKKPESKAIYQRLRDLSWQAARYRNLFMQRYWAEACGWRMPDNDDKHAITKQGRATEKAELSGAAYSAAEREVSGAWTRDAKRILAGAPIPRWKPTAALAIRGHKNKRESGVRLEVENNQYVAYLQAQAATCEGGSWLRVPIAKHTRRDDYQGDILNGMVAWSVPIAKATVEVGERDVTLRLSYAITVPLPKAGERVATLGPVNQEDVNRKRIPRLLLRTETQTQDYTSQLDEIRDKKTRWDFIRRRVTCQIGRRHGHARLKRQKLAHLSWDDWLHSHLHQWTRKIADWCDSQGVGTIRIESIDTGDWPAYKFVQLLTYKAEELGITVSDGADLKDESGARAAKAAIEKRRQRGKKRGDALRELTHQLKETA